MHDLQMFEPARQPKDMGEPETSASPWMPAVLLTCAMFCSTLWIQFLGGAGGVGEPVVLVFSPLLSKTETFLAASTLSVPIIESGPLPFLVTVISEGPETLSPDYSPRSVGGCGMRVIQCCLWAKARASRSRYRVL